MKWYIYLQLTSIIEPPQKFFVFQENSACEYFVVYGLHVEAAIGDYHTVVRRFESV